MQEKIINGKECSTILRNKLKDEIEKFETKPGLVDIQIGNDEASNIYIASKKKAAENLGINFHHVHFENGASEEEIINKILELNNDDSINGILIQLPLPKGYDEKKLINYINPDKDVDGLTELNMGKLFLGKKCLVSCTPSGVLELLKYKNIKIEGKHVVIVGRSNLVGKPLIELFLKENATVTVCHSKTGNLANYTKQADILVVAAGKKHLIKEDMIKENSIIIDVGINRENGKIYGDVDFDNVLSKVKYITPVPGGVGPMTIAMLLNNVVLSYKKQKKF